MTEARQALPQRLRRFFQLPQPPDEVWQGGIVPMPTWIDRGPDVRPERPWAAVWVSLTSGLVHLELEPDLGQHGPALGLDALLAFGLKRYKGLAGRPARIQVEDPALGVFIAERLSDPGLAVEVVSDLHAVRHVIRMFAEDATGRPQPPGPLEAPGVTLDAVRGFAEAAAACWDRAPWHDLTDADTIRIESPTPLRGMAWLTVFGRDGSARGVRFHGEPPDPTPAVPPAAVRRSRAATAGWTLRYGPIDVMPCEDADLWLACGLPVAGDEAYPWIAVDDAGHRRERADGATMALVEAVLRALATASETAIDAGRWTTCVESSGGTVEVKLALPLLLPDERDHPRWAAPVFDRRAMERSFVELDRVRRDRGADSAAARDRLSADYAEQRAAGRLPAQGQTPIEQAQDLVFDAFEARGRRRLVLAREALALDPDAADALVILAEQAGSPVRALPLYERAIEAARRRLDPRTLELELGRFWDLLPTRPYMRALAGLAGTLAAVGRIDEAATHYQEMLRLNPNDDQGARLRLLALLVEFERHGDAEALADLYPDEDAAGWRWLLALTAFRREGDGAEARRRLDAAMAANRLVAPLLLAGEPQEDPVDAADADPGSPDEAAACARVVRPLWRGTSGAADWLARAAASSRPGRRLTSSPPRTAANRRRPKR